MQHADQQAGCNPANVKAERIAAHNAQAALQAHRATVERLTQQLQAEVLANLGTCRPRSQNSLKVVSAAVVRVVRSDERTHF